MTENQPESPAAALAPEQHAHNHFCEVCLQAVAHCSGECQHPGPQYCSVHVPVEHHEDPDHPYFGAKVADKPTVRMTVKVAD